MLIPLWLRRLATRPTVVAGYTGIANKPLRECTDEEMRAIAAQHAQRATKGRFDEDLFLRGMLAAREEQRNPLEGAGLLFVVGLAWSRLVQDAALRNSGVRWLYRMWGRIEGRLEDRLHRDEFEEDEGTRDTADFMTVSERSRTS